MQDTSRYSVLKNGSRLHFPFGYNHLLGFLGNICLFSRLHPQICAVTVTPRSLRVTLTMRRKAGALRRRPEEA